MKFLCTMENNINLLIKSWVGILLNTAMKSYEVLNEVLSFFMIRKIIIRKNGEEYAETLRRSFIYRPN